MIPMLLIASLGVQAPHHRQLVFDRDFSKISKVDPAIWNYETDPPANHEKEVYTGPGEGNVHIEDGALVLVAKRDAAGKITSGRITTKQTFKYCKVEVVAKVPTGRGTWPAIWMLGQSLRESGAAHRDWPKCGEIDIMENVGFDPDSFHTSVHTGKYNWMNNTELTIAKTIANGPAKFHKFGMDWTKAGMTFTIDGEKIVHWDRRPGGEDAWPFDAPCYLILNLAIGGDWGGQKGIDNSIFPAKFEIKSVKIWE